MGTIDEILAHPASVFVARFTRTRNVFPGRSERIGDGCRVRLEQGPTLARDRASLDGPVTVGVRPEDIRILSPKEAPAGAPRGRVVALRAKPTCTEIELDVGVRLIAIERRGIGAHELSEGQSVALGIDASTVKVFAAP